MEKFPKSTRLRFRRDYEKVSRNGMRRSGQSIQIELRAFQSGSPGTIRLGITVTRKYGKANERNRFKRLVREAFRRLPLKGSFDLIVKPKKSDSLAPNALKMQDIHTDLMGLLHEYIGRKPQS